MKKSKAASITWIILLWIILILCLSFWLKWNKKSEWNFAIIPHFMLDNEKVDKFYDFLKNEYYHGWEPEKIILISPNHFHSQTKEILTICKSADVSYNSNTRNLNSELSDLWIKCDESGEIFEPWWDSLKTNEHWIWEHFQWINKYFPNSEVLPIISPCFQLSAVENILTNLKGLNWNILVIASVDFAHYQNEQQTLQHDQKSIETLKSMTLNQSEFIDWVDADCPVCLYLLQTLANQNWKKAELRYRDSSSTILWKDMKEENTSRLFIWYK